MLIWPASVLAQTDEIQEGTSKPLDNVTKIVGNIYKTANKNTVTEYIGLAVSVFLSLLGVIFVGLMIYAGYNWMTAGGNEEKVSEAGKTIKWALIGIIVLIGVYAIWHFVFKRLIIQ